MKFSLTKKSLQNFAGDCVVLFAIIDKDSNYKAVQKLINLNNFEASIGKTLMLNFVSGFKTKRLIIVGLGEVVSAKNYKKALNSLTLTLQDAKVKNVMLEKVNVDEYGDLWVYRTTAIVIQNATYKVDKVHIANDCNDVIDNISMQSNVDSASALELGKGMAIASGMALTRSLGDMPSNICTPTYLAQVAQDLAQEYTLECDILEESEMLAHNMHSLLSVSKGSVEPPKLISLSYIGKGKARPIVLVGKGVTFDSGGISLKPGSNMDEMKYDMSGAGAVLGTMKAVAKMRLPINLTVVIPAVENMPAHNASKPGDVVKSMSGQTIEILNTDAEGRLILCDALTYCGKFNPQAVIDIATLTGAVIIALGKHNTGLMSNDQVLADKIIKAAKTSLDGVWQLPIEEEYDELLKSNFADMANIGGREAGSITAACFLARYTKDYSWAHLDIAGTAWVGGDNKGASGRPVMLLSQYIMDEAG